MFGKLLSALLFGVVEKEVYKASEKLQKKVIWTEKDDVRVKSEINECMQQAYQEVQDEFRIDCANQIKGAEDALLVLGYPKKK